MKAENPSLSAKNFKKALDFQGLFCFFLCSCSVVAHDPVRAVIYDFAENRAGKHARRKFFELQEHGQSQIAGEALRETRARPLLEDLKAWLLACRGKIPNGSSSAKAIDYTLKRWAALTHYLTNGRVPIDHNWIEN